MFLDDELLEICRSADISKPDDIQKLYSSLGIKCEEYYKSKLIPGISRKDALGVLDRTFNLWDSFVRIAIKEGGKMAIIGKLFQKYSFKKEFMSHKNLSKIYKSL